MRRTLLVTNDFPPRIGGIESYLYELVSRLDPRRVAVFASSSSGDPAAEAAFDAAQPFPVTRHPGMLLPTPAVLHGARRALTAHRASAVWFGAAAPLGLLAPGLRAAGARWVLASTHGHEVGWSMLPGARQALRRIGEHADVLTYVSRYTRSRFAAALGPRAVLEHLPPGVDTDRFAPDPLAGAAVRDRLGLADRLVVGALSRLVPRKGQDVLIAALPAVRAALPSAALLIVGEGRDRARLANLAARAGVAEHVTFTGPAPPDALPAWYNACHVFALPCRTRGLGLDVEGFGLTFLEAAACALPVVAGDSGGAPEAVLAGSTGHVVPGRAVTAVADAVVDAARRPDLGTAGRAHARRAHSWHARAARLAALLD